MTEEREDDKMRRLIGDKRFYMMVLSVAVPIMIQNGITNFVGLLNNIMVGRVGTEQMTGVAIVNQLIFVFNLCIFGAISGVGIFGTQFSGSQNYEGHRNTFRFKVLLSLGLVVLGITTLLLGGDSLIQLYLHKGSDAGDLNKVLQYGKDYMSIMLIGLLPYAATQVYASTLRETGETVLPMKAGIVAVCINLTLNYILIFGMFGAPALGVKGAAVATVISRYVEAAITLTWTHRHKERNHFIVGAYRSLRIPATLIKRIILRGAPLMINEAMWAGGMTIMIQCYSIRGLSVIAAVEISTTISNFFNVVFIALGSAVSIIIGRLLGAGKMEEARETDGKLIFFSVVSCIFIGTLMLSLASLFPGIYNTTAEVKGLARNFIMISALCMPLNAFTHATYFTLRSGGKTIITFIFDSAFVWAVNIPLAFCLTHFTDWHIVLIYLCCQLTEIIKCIIGFILVKKGVWLHNIVAETEA